MARFKAATGRGLLYAAQCLLADQGRGVRGMTVAIQGYGNVGAWAARLFAAAGAQIVAISDVTGAVRWPGGVDLPALDAHLAKTGGVAGFPGADAFPADQIFAVECDILLPAALGGVLTKTTAPEVQAKIVLEGANHPTDPEADEILAKKGVVVVPDIYANAGGVTVSYFEWVQNLAQYYWEEEKVNQDLSRVMSRAWTDLTATAKTHGCDLRTAAFALAIGRVAKATALRGC